MTGFISVVLLGHDHDTDTPTQECNIHIPVHNQTLSLSLSLSSLSLSLSLSLSHSPPPSLSLSLSTTGRVVQSHTGLSPKFSKGFNGIKAIGSAYPAATARSLKVWSSFASWSIAWMSPAKLPGGKFSGRVCTPKTINPSGGSLTSITDIWKRIKRTILVLWMEDRERPTLCTSMHFLKGLKECTTWAISRGVQISFIGSNLRSSDL